MRGTNDRPLVMAKEEVNAATVKNKDRRLQFLEFGAPSKSVFTRWSHDFILLYAPTFHKNRNCENYDVL